jgi:hypothetical protein
LQLKGDALSVDFTSLPKTELEKKKQSLQERYRDFQAKKLNLNMARGKPGTDQLRLSEEMLNILTSDSNLHASTGEDCRNYGLPNGLPELRTIFAQMMDVDADHVILGGNSSLNMMFDTVSPRDDERFRRM